MATLNMQGTKFSVSVLPLKFFTRGDWVRTEISINNEYVTYNEIGENISREEMEEWLVSMCRLLAGAYGRERNLSFERAGIAVDLYPHTKDGEEVSRQERRENDCVMAFRLLMRSTDKKRLLGGVYTFLFHREEIEKFATDLREEFDAVFAKLVHGRGKYLFVGVSPLGYKGCKYWYLDQSGTVKPGDYVWVRMGKHDLEQIVYVDDVKYFNDDTVPYDPAKVKQVLRKARREEME